MKWLKGLGRKIIAWLQPRCIPYLDEIVTGLILNTASLELKRDEFAEFAAVKGMYGPFRLWGNSLPVITYTVFEKELMEFVKVRVQIAKPSTIRFEASIDSTTAPERHGEGIECKEAYKKPFWSLSIYLINYFPYCRSDQRFRPDKPRVIKGSEHFSLMPTAADMREVL